MKGPPPPDPARHTLGNGNGNGNGNGADNGAERYEVPELAFLARNAWKSLDEHGRDVHGQWQRFTALVTPWQREPHRPEADRLLARLAPTLARQGTPTFHAHEVLHWAASKFDPWSRPTILSSVPSLQDLLSPQLASAWGLRPPRRGEPPSATAARIAGDLDRSNLGKTTLWPREQRWFVAGNLDAELKACLEKHCPRLVLARPGFMPALAQRLREQHNPWHHTPRWFAQLSFDALHDCGLRLDAAVWHWLSAVLLRESAGLGHELTRHDTALAERARQELSALLARRFVLSEAQAWILFVLRAARDSCLVVLRAEADFSVWTAVAHLGAGRIIRLRCSHYPLDDAAPLSMTSEQVSRNRFEAHLDGGDVHLRILELDGVDLLKGWAAPAVGEQEAF
jgi:hypothetical protein